MRLAGISQDTVRLVEEWVDQETLPYVLGEGHDTGTFSETGKRVCPCRLHYCEVRSTLVHCML